MWAQRDALLALSGILVAAGLSQPFCANSEDEVSMLQQWSDLNWNSEAYSQPSVAIRSSRSYPYMPETPASQQANFAYMQAPTRQLPEFALSASRQLSPSSFIESSSLDAATTGIERQLQELRTSDSAAQASSEVAALKRTVQELRQQAQNEATQLNSAQEQQRLSNNAVDNAKIQLQRQIVNAQDAWQSEQQARESERKALKAAADETQKEEALENELKRSKEQVEKLVQERSGFSNKLVLLEQEKDQVSAKQHKAWELAMLQERQSEKKAWFVAKKEAEKAVAEKKLKEKLLAEAKAELSGMKQHVDTVQAQAAQAMQKEVQQVNHKVDEVKQAANVELRKAADQLHSEHDEVKSVVDWAHKVQQRADAKVKWVKSAQEQVASQVNWATIAKREAARASAAMEEMEQLKTVAAKTNGEHPVVAEGATGNFGF